IGRDDPLDSFLLHHPEALFGRPVESTVLDPDNPVVLGPHLCAAAVEIPLTERDLELFGPGSAAVVADLVERGLLRHRFNGWFWPSPERPSELANLRGGGRVVDIVESATGRLLGTVDAASAPATVHAGAVYLHRGESYLVDSLDLEDGCAFVAAA